MSPRIYVFFDDSKVGELSGTASETAFRYDSHFLGTGLALSPLLMKLGSEGLLNTDYIKTESEFERARH